MARRKRKMTSSFETVATTTLAGVVGGRMMVRTGPDPEVLQGIATLAETVGQVGQVLQQKQAERQGMMQQMMQQVMGARGR
jgi:hypothetical protein